MAIRKFSFVTGLAAIAIASSVVIGQQTPPQPPAGQPGQTQGEGRGRGGRGAGTPLVNGECPPGMTETRPNRCQAPEFPPPSILDYRPRNTLVRSETLVPKAKYPVVDIHSHTGPTPETIDRLVSEMDAMGLRVLVNLSGGSDPAAVKQKVDFIRSSKHANRFAVFANVQWDGAGGQGWAEKAVGDLEQAVKNGAIGLKIAKNLGISAKKHDGSRLNIPVIIHTAEPSEFFSPLDYKNERWLELALFPDRRNFQEGKATFDELQAERDRMFEANPKTRYIGAHFAYYGHNLPGAAKLLDRLPNVVLEVAAVLYDFGRQPRASRDFFIKYQDRILFGKDSYAPDEFPYYWRVFETKDEYFDYYRDYHAFWKLYGMDLPDEVLKKIYYKNALRVTPGLPKNQWPQ
jgi:predicted TIM-barrel fold metal-dependent hydrolase